MVNWSNKGTHVVDENILVLADAFANLTVTWPTNKLDTMPAPQGMFFETGEAVGVPTFPKPKFRFKQTLKEATINHQGRMNPGYIMNAFVEQMKFSGSGGSPSKIEIFVSYNIAANQEEEGSYHFVFESLGRKKTRFTYRIDGCAVTCWKCAFFPSVFHQGYQGQSPKGLGKVHR